MNRQDLINRLVFLFRIQETLGRKNYRRFKREHLQELLSSVVVIAVEVLYQSRNPDQFEHLSQIEINQKTESWKELIEHHFNEAILELATLRDEGLPVSLLIPKEHLTIIAHMTELTDNLIENERSSVLQVSRRSDDRSGTEG